MINRFVFIFFISLSFAQDIAIVLSQDYSAFHDAKNGFMDTFSKNYSEAVYSEFIYKKKNTSILFDKIQRLNPDAIFCIGQKATHFSTSTFADIPIVFSMVADPVSTGLLSMGETGRIGFSGVTTRIKKDSALQTIINLLGTNIHIVVAYSTNSDLEALQLTDAAKKTNVNLTTVLIKQSNEMGKATKFVKENSVFWILTDPSIYSARTLMMVLKTINKKNGIILAPTEKFLNQKYPAHIAISITPEENGSQGAHTLNRMLNNPDSIQLVESPKNIHIAVKKGVEILTNEGVKWVE